MKDNNLRTQISYCNDDRDYKIYNYLRKKRGKSNFIKDLIEKEMLREEKEKEYHE